MNLGGFEFDSGTVGVLNEIERSGKLPHALILEGENATVSSLAVLLSAFAVCESGKKPCGACKQCLTALQRNHADIIWVKPDTRKGRTSDTYSIEQARELVTDAAIKPNSGSAKVYIFEDCDRRMSELVQNTLLKTIEEPPPGVCFFLLCSSALSFLSTVRSRCRLIKTGGDRQYSEETIESAEKIAAGIISLRGYELMLSLKAVEDKKRQLDIIEALERILRDSLMLSMGARASRDSDAIRALSRKLTIKKLIEMIGLCAEAREKIGANVNSKLLATWLCGEFRRISWQR